MNLVIDKAELISKIFFGVFWITAVIAFPGQEFMQSAYDAFSSYLYALLDMIIILLGLWVMRSKTDWLMLISFAVLAYVSTCICNNLSLLFCLNGMRLYIGYLFAIPIFRYFLSNPLLREQFIARMDKTLYAFLWVQVPCTCYQCALYGAYDLVGGSLGWMMSGVITTLIYLISFYLMLRRWDKTKSYFSNLLDNWILIFLLFPSFLNETKIAFVFFAMYFFFLVPMDRNFIKRLIFILPIMALLLTGAFYFYYSTTGNENDILSEEYISFYLQGDEDSLNLVELAFDGQEMETAEDQGSDWARGLKLAVIPWMFQTEDYAPYVGFGIGQFKGGTILEKSKFYKEYEWILQGTALQVQIFLLETGLIGLGWSILFWIVSFKLFKKCKRHYQLQFYMLLVVIITSIYNCCFIIMPFYLIFLYMTMLSSERSLIEKSEIEQETK